MRHSLKLGAAAMVAFGGGGSFYLGAAETPAFAQATANGPAAQSATTGTTAGGTPDQPQARVSRPRPGARGTDVRGGQGRPGLQTAPDALPPGNTALTAGECNRVGGTISYNEACPYSIICTTTVTEVVNGRTIVTVRPNCIDEIQR